MRVYHLLCLAALCLGAADADASLNYPTEYWVNSEQGWVVETKPCNETLCGYLVGFRAVHSHPAGYIPLDALNPDPAKRDRPLCGLQLMGGFLPSKRASGDWNSGWIYDPDSGKTYSGVISVIDADTVKLRGYVGIPLFGRTLTLRREAGAVTQCSSAAKD